MANNEEQFERVGRWLDGEPIELTQPEKALADEIRRDEAGARLLLAAPAPREAIDRVHRRMLAELARPVHRTKWIRYAAGAVAAVAGAVLVAGSFLGWFGRANPSEPSAPVTKAPSGEVPIEVIVEKMTEPSRNLDLEVLAKQVDELNADMAVSMLSPSASELQVDALQHEIDEFWLDDTVSWPLDG
jgi:hypothetical protein